MVRLACSGEIFRLRHEEKKHDRNGLQNARQHVVGEKNHQRGKDAPNLTNEGENPYKDIFVSPFSAIFNSTRGEKGKGARS